MNYACAKEETRIIPEETAPKFLAQHLKPYKFLRQEAKDKTVLEIGCGDGYGSAYLAEGARKVTGIDYEEAVIYQAQNKYKRVNLGFARMDAANLQFTDNSFDIVCSFQVIEHIPEDRLSRYLSEVSRVLKDDGKFYLSTLNVEHAVKSPLTYKKHPAHCKEFKLEELRDLLSNLFANVKIYGLQLTMKHRFYQRLKKIGIFNFAPKAVNPVSRFYKNVTINDFCIVSKNLTKAIDFICICTKRLREHSNQEKSSLNFSL